MKRTICSVLLLSILLGCRCGHAQCPYIKAALIKGCGASEGPNEFIVVNTGTLPLDITTARLDYAVTVVAWTVDGSTTGIWTTKTGAGILTNSSGTLTTINSGSVPAGKPWIIIPANVSVNYDFGAFGADVYVSYYDPAKAFSFSTTGNFANSGTGLRTFTLTSPSCTRTASYAPSSLVGAAGAGAVWNSTGVAKYVNTGCGAIVLPVAVSGFSGQAIGDKVSLNWQLDNAAGYTSTVIEQSRDARDFRQRGQMPVIDDRREYVFIDDVAGEGRLWYRLRLIRTDGRSEYTQILALNASNDDPSDLKLSPNPATDQLQIQLDNKYGSECQIEIWHPSGNCILRRNYSLGKGENAWTIPVSSLQAGLYFIRVLQGNEVWQERWIKQ